MKFRTLAVAVLAIQALASGCTTSAGAPPPSASAAAGGEAAADSDPGPGVCGEQITTFRRVLRQDRSMGFLGKDVQAAITVDVERAAAACRSGNDAQAQAILAATKKKHGYH